MQIFRHICKSWFSCRKAVIFKFVFQRNEYFVMFIDKNINLTLKSLFATQMTIFILCRISCRYSDIFGIVGFRVGKLSYLNLYFSEMNISAMFIDKNINLILKSLFATQTTMFILCRTSCRYSDIFAKVDFRVGKLSYLNLYFSEMNIS